MCSMSGVMIHGSSADGWDAREMKGMYVSPCGQYWGSQPFTEEQRKADIAHNRQERLYKAIHDHLRKEGHDIYQEIKLIFEKKSKMSLRLRKFVVSLLQENKETDE